MPNDVICLNALACELNALLRGGRIEKVYQPETDEITLSVKNNGKMHTLVASANPSRPRLHITTQKKENALVAPAFCMLLRKYLTGGNITDISVFNSDRIIKISFDARNELKDREKYLLIVELMGRYSNIILLEGSYKIIDAVRRIHFDQSTTRYILPGLFYVLQPKNRASLDDSDALDTVFCRLPSDADELVRLVSGIGKESAKEIIISENPRNALDGLFRLYDSTAYCPSLLYRNGVLKDYYPRPYNSVEGEFVPCASLNNALDQFYTLFDGEERKKASSKTVVAVLKRLQNKTERRIQDNADKIAERNKAERLRICGELLLSYGHEIKVGQTAYNAYDYYENCTVSIALDEFLTPQQNAQEYFKKYGKLKRGIEVAIRQLDELQQQSEYLKSIETAINNCSTKQEFEEILNELNQLSGQKQKENGKRKISRPTVFLYKGREIIFGKNNGQNNEVTFKLASRNDIWLHVKSYHGSHVVVRGEEPDDDVLLRAAQIAAFYSGAKNNGKVDVDFTQVKYVKKIPSSPLGMVTYTHYQTITVVPLKDDK